MVLLAWWIHIIFFFEKTVLINTLYNKFILKFTVNIYKMALFHLVTLLILFLKNNKYNEQKMNHIDMEYIHPK